jgi:hypothetical protein
MFPEPRRFLPGETLSTEAIVRITFRFRIQVSSGYGSAKIMIEGVLLKGLLRGQDLNLRPLGYEPEGHETLLRSQLAFEGVERW